jgi:hypothetical protein
MLKIDLFAIQMKDRAHVRLRLPHDGNINAIAYNAQDDIVYATVYRNNRVLPIDIYVYEVRRYMDRIKLIQTNKWRMLDASSQMIFTVQPSTGRLLCNHYDYRNNIRKDDILISVYEQSDHIYNIRSDINKDNSAWKNAADNPPNGVNVAHNRLIINVLMSDIRGNIYSTSQNSIKFNASGVMESCNMYDGTKNDMILPALGDALLYTRGACIDRTAYVVSLDYTKILMYVTDRYVGQFESKINVRNAGWRVYDQIMIRDNTLLFAFTDEIYLYDIRMRKQYAEIIVSDHGKKYKPYFTDKMCMVGDYLAYYSMKQNTMELIKI